MEDSYSAISLVSSAQLLFCEHGQDFARSSPYLISLAEVQQAQVQDHNSIEDTLNRTLNQ